MSFKNLEQRFNETVNELYAAAKTKFENGRESNGRNDDPIITRRVGDGYWGFGEGRSVPLRSAALDVQRLTLFTLSQRGIIFLAKQQLLQTGNTFEHTRIINPAFVVANGVPFLHVRRQLRPFKPFKNLIGRTDASALSLKDLRKRGQFQEETYNKLVNNNEATFSSFLKKIPVIGQTISAVNAKLSVGDSNDDDNWNISRPELGKDTNSYINVLRNRENTTFKYGGVVSTGTVYGFSSTTPVAYYSAFALDGTAPLNSDYYSDSQAKPSLRRITLYPQTDPIRTTLLSETASGSADNLSAKLSDSDIKLELNRQHQNYFRENNANESNAYLKYFTGGEGSIIGRRSLVSTTADGTSRITNQNAKYISDAYLRGQTGVNTSDRKISYIKDPMNEEYSSTNVLSRYSNLKTITPGDSSNEALDDAITVSFAMGNNNHVQFRAFVRDLNQSANPEYKSYQYIGRTERFITYNGIEREINFKLDILAFSKDELPIVWNRINYLTGMVFPYGVNRGILQPNIIRFTIGNVFANQYGHVSSFSTSFSEITETWDIDSEVPIGATVSMGIKIIEKRRMDAGKSFYGITE